MNLEQMEEIQQRAYELKAILDKEQKSIMSTEFSRFFAEVEKAFATAIVEAYKAGELVKKLPP